MSKMYSPKFILLFLAIPLLLASAINCAKTEDNYGDGVSPPNPQTCTNCSICQYPDCSHPHPHPPPPSEYPAYGAPPPPAAPLECPPASPAQSRCCSQYSPPYPYTFYNETESAASPMPKPLNPSGNIWSTVVFCLLLFVSVLHV